LFKPIMIPNNNVFFVNSFQLTLFLFAKKYNKKKLFFQKIEIGPLRRYLEIEDLEKIIHDVEKCKGNILKLPMVQIQFANVVQIPTETVTPDYVQFQKCDNKSHTNIMFSQHEATTHAILEWYVFFFVSRRAKF